LSTWDPTLMTTSRLAGGMALTPSRFINRPRHLPDPISDLTGCGPEHRPEAHGFEHADPEEIRIEGAGDQGHHRDERVDDQHVLCKEGQCDEEKRETERSPRP